MNQGCDRRRYYDIYVNVFKIDVIYIIFGFEDVTQLDIISFIVGHYFYTFLWNAIFLQDGQLSPDKTNISF